MVVATAPDGPVRVTWAEEKSTDSTGWNDQRWGRTASGKKPGFGHATYPSRGVTAGTVSPTT